MIFDKIANAGLYKGMHPSMDKAIDFMMTADLHALPLGRTVIDGDRVFINKMQATTAPAEEKQFEVHRKYLDIQIDLSGQETIETGDRDVFFCADFSEEKDVGFAHCPAIAACTLGNGTFTVCMAGEPHKPGITAGPDTALLKCVIKVMAWEAV
jgi:YhcH/YjgK/YiaL family protein